MESYQRHHSCPLLFMPTQCRPQGKMFTIWQKGASWGRAAGRHMMGHSQAPSEDPGTYLGRATAPRARGPAGERGSDTALELGQCSHTYTHARARARNTHTHTQAHQTHELTYGGDTYEAQLRQTSPWSTRVEATKHHPAGHRPPLPRLSSMVGRGTLGRRADHKQHASRPMNRREEQATEAPQKQVYPSTWKLMPPVISQLTIVSLPGHRAERLPLRPPATPPPSSCGSCSGYAWPASWCAFTRYSITAVLHSL